MSYHSESAKVQDMPHVMQFITGDIIDIGCGNHRITPEALGIDGRDLPGVGFVTDKPYDIPRDLYVAGDKYKDYDTVFSSHFLEHLENQYMAVLSWSKLLRDGGHLVLYLPDGRHYNNQENPEHMIDMNYDQFMFWFRRCFCGEGKDFRGEHLTKIFDLVESGMDIGPDRYSFYVIAKKV